ncbi:succinyl-CoA ligase subunit beta [Hibiscus syriacus]|uniref:Succinyl-CoA ligase subunit beta n=1 Tax=Hibiscus syriacus TaxID=106335 RepID=A0A6A2Y8A6_HIBSY|nr:succinyl-CoA ligase subunit beta [Hibiscus syriacus]
MMSQLAPSDPSGGYTRPPSCSTSPTNSQQPPNFTSTWAYHARGPTESLSSDHSKASKKPSPSPSQPPAPTTPGNSEISPTKKSGDEGTLVPTRDKINGCRNLKEVYGLRKGWYNGRATLPMLWGVDRKEVICNDSYDIIEFFNSGINGLDQNPGLDLSPAELKGCGCAQSHEAYDVAVNGLFNTLDKMDDHLGGSRYLCGDRLTLADICLFTTLIRFDVVYNVLFKCTKKKLHEFPNLHGYMRDIYQIPKVAATCNFPEIMDGYYWILFPLNPGSIRPVLPSGCDHESLSRPHNRESMSAEDQRVQCVA